MKLQETFSLKNILLYGAIKSTYKVHMFQADFNCKGKINNAPKKS